MYSVQELAKKWGLTDRRVREMCAKGLIAGVQKIGKSYLIPKTATKPTKTKIKPATKSNGICIVCKNSKDIVFSSLVYNFYRNDTFVDSNVSVLEIDKKLKVNKVDIKSISKNLSNSTYKCVIFVECIDKAILKNIGNVKRVYIGQKAIKNRDINQIVGYSLPDVTSFSNLAISLFCLEGVLKQIYDIVNNILNDCYTFPLTFNFNNIDYTPSLIYELPTIQKSYEFLAKQYDSFEESDEFFTISIGNQVEFSDSNQELDYAVKIIDALKRNVSAKFIYIYDQSSLKLHCKHFSTKAYLQNINEKSAFYLVPKSLLDTETLNAINQGIIFYKNNGVYHDNITDYSLGYLNANKEDIDKYQKIVDHLINISTKICSLQEMEEFYELHK